MKKNDLLISAIIIFFYDVDLWSAYKTVTPCSQVLEKTLVEIVFFFFLLHKTTAL